MGFFERDGTKTIRRQLRQATRSNLGTSSDPAPGAESAIRAARTLSEILNYATNGQLRLGIIERKYPGDEILAFDEALARAKAP